MSDNEKASSGTFPHQPYATPRPSKIANPGSLGLLSFASTTLILSLFNVNARHIVAPNVVVGMAIFCGGLAQLLAGMWEFPRGNMFAATAFTSYGAFWMSFAAILLPSTGIVAAYEGDPQEFHDALGVYLITWFIVTFILFIASLRKNAAFVTLFLFLWITFVLLAAANFVNSLRLTKAGGGMGIATALVAYYIALSELLGGEKYKLFTLPLGDFNAE
jgi:succinate-acetate transporter protein